MLLYIPVTIAQLKAVATGTWEPGNAYGVTAALLADHELTGADGIGDAYTEEELSEYVRDLAADASIHVLGSPLRAVIAAEVSTSRVSAAGGHPAAVTVTGLIDVSELDSAFMDDASAAADVAAAVAGNAEAQERLDEHELLWYDASEIDHLAGQ